MTLTLETIAPADPTALDRALAGEVHFSFAFLEDLKNSWDRFVAELGGDIYMSYDWCKTWWDHYGRSRCLQIFIFRSDSTLHGLVPMFIDDIGFGPARVRMAKLLGSEFTMARCHPPVRPEHAPAIFNRILTYLIGHQGCDAVWFGPVAATHESMPALDQITRRPNPPALVARDTVLAPHTVFELPPTFDDYLRALDKRQRGNYRRDMNLLHKNFKVKVDVVQDAAEGLAEFSAFVTMHAQQWQALGKQGHFADWPGAEAFNRDLLCVQAAAGRLRLVRLWADNRVVAYQLCYRFGDTWHWRLPARCACSTWNRFGLGRLGLITLVQVALAEGVKRIEGGAGHYHYKTQLGGVEHPLRSLLLVGDCATSQRRVRLFGVLSDALHLGYYRLWFNRLAPRLPFRRRPLWTSWIQMRI